jgi:oligogalacturonide transporter
MIMGKTNKLSLVKLAGYGIGDLYGGGSFILIGSFYMFFLTQVIGLSPTVAGFIFAIGKVWDAISDRTRSRYGRRRLFFLLAPLPIFVSFVMMWLPLKGNGSLLTVLYYIGTYLFFNTVFTMVMVPYTARSRLCSRPQFPC